jgi:hypothetical protein
MKSSGLTLAGQSTLGDIKHGYQVCVRIFGQVFNTNKQTEEQRTKAQGTKGTEQKRSEQRTPPRPRTVKTIAEPPPSLGLGLSPYQLSPDLDRR